MQSNVNSSRKPHRWSQRRRRPAAPPRRHRSHSFLQKIETVRGGNYNLWPHKLPRRTTSTTTFQTKDSRSERRNFQERAYLVHQSRSRRRPCRRRRWIRNPCSWGWAISSAQPWAKTPTNKCESSQYIPAKLTIATPRTTHPTCTALHAMSF